MIIIISDIQYSIISWRSSFDVFIFFWNHPLQKVRDQGTNEMQRGNQTTRIPLEPTPKRIIKLDYRGIEKSSLIQHIIFIDVI